MAAATDRKSDQRLYATGERVPLIDSLVLRFVTLPLITARARDSWLGHVSTAQCSVFPLMTLPEFKR